MSGDRQNKLAARLSQVRTGQPEPVAPAPTPRAEDPVAPGAPGRRGAPRWEDTHRRATFHLPNDLLDALQRFCDQSGRNKSEVARTALAEYLDRQP